MVAQNMLRMYDVTNVFTRKKIGIDNSLDVTKCLNQIRIPDLPNTCT